MQNREARSKPRSRGLIWLIGGLLLGGIFLLLQATTAPPPKPQPQPATIPKPPATQEVKLEAAEPAPAEPQTESPVTAESSAMTAEMTADETRVVAEITRQCAAESVQHLLIPEINGIVRCEKEPMCSWDEASIAAMHRKLTQLLSQVEPGDAQDTTRYLTEIGCSSRLL
jgi:hypothetical protein